jgi:hypothetical protein
VSQVFSIRNANNWQSFYSDTFLAQQGLQGYVPIPPVIIPLQASSPLLHVTVNVDQPGRNWHSGGYLSPLFDNPLALARSTSFWLPINDSKLILLTTEYSSTYQLKYSPPRWFQRCTLTIFEYTGAINDTLTEQLNGIQNQLTSIQNQLYGDFNAG